MRSTLRTVLAAVAVLLPSLARADGGQLDKFPPAARQQITKAAADFVIGESGLYWDRQVQVRKISRVAGSAKAEAEDDAFSDQCGCAPLWFSAMSGRSLLSDKEILAESAVEVNPDGCAPTTDRFECVNVLQGDRCVVERWKNNSAAEKAWLDRARLRTMPSPLGNSSGPNSPPSKRLPPPPPPWVETDDLVIMTGHAFASVGDKVDAPCLVEKGSESINGQLYRVVKACPAPSSRSTVKPVSPEQLATAILDGQARLTEWRWYRPKNETIEWRSKDVTPSPAAGSAPAAPSPAKTTGTISDKHSAVRP